jgi:hypothetical protein
MVQRLSCLLPQMVQLGWDWDFRLLPHVVPILWSRLLRLLRGLLRLLRGLLRLLRVSWPSAGRLVVCRLLPPVVRRVARYLLPQMV